MGKPTAVMSQGGSFLLYEGKGGDPFWDKAERLLYTALIGFIHYEAPKDEQNFSTLIEMINAMEVREDDPTFKNAVDMMFEQLEKKNPNHFAVRQYAKYKLAAGKTAQSILISCGARMAPFDIGELRELTSYDELELDTLGDEKTALFLIMSDTDPTFNFLISMIYTQLFNLLCEKADDFYGGRLPVHVRCLIDECANIGQIPNLEKLMATIRSREISAMLVLQAKSQLKAIYKESADTIIGNCDLQIFLGGSEQSTLKDLNATLGKETIDMYNTGETRGSQESYKVRYYSWSGSVIGKMLRNPVYKGDHVVCKCHQKAIRSNTVNFIPRDQWEIIENCHEAIVSREQWDRVQKLIDRRPPIMQGNSCPFYNLFHGLVYCATCGKSMQVRYEKVGRTGKNRFTGEMREPIDKTYYICQTYNRLGKNACTSHKIEARDLYNLVLSDIMEHGKMALQDAEAFYGRLTRRLEQRYSIDEKSLKREQDALAKRNQEIDDMFMSLYADKAKGILTEQRFLRMTEALEQEQADNKAQMQAITDELRIASSADSDVRRFIGEIREYASITELDEAILNRLIDKIFISAVEVIDSEKVQKVRIIYNFVGEIYKE